MYANDESFINQINTYNLNMLRAELIKYYFENKELRAWRTATEKINTESFLQYSELEKKAQSLEAEVKELKTLLEKEINKNTLRAKSTFGRKTEGLLTLIESSENKTEDFDDESQSEDTEEVISSGSNKAEDFKNRIITPEMSNGKAVATGRKAGKKSRLSESIKNLPKQIKYNIDISSLDQRYGKGNWRIAFWHSHETIEKMDTPFYRMVSYTPAISVGLEHSLITMPYTNPLIPRSYVSASLMSYIYTQKYMLALPANRISVDLKMQGIDLSKQCIINWINSIAPMVFEPIVNHLTNCLLRYKYTQNDETYIQVNKDDRGPGHKSYMWVHCSSEYLKCNPIVIFCYESTRNTNHLREFFGEFMGYITCDAYISYQVLENESNGNVTVSGCFMHARRYLAEAFFVNDISNMNNDELLELPETIALLKIRDIYQEEKKLKGLTSDERLVQRKDKVKPLVDAFFEYMHELSNRAEIYSERLQKAITYAINQEQHLRVFLDDGNICCDNGNAERIIRAYSVGRANWLFADTVDGAKVNALMYSVVETAKANKVNVQIYLRYLLEEVPKHLADTNDEYLDDMMPWSEKYHDYEQRHMISRTELYQRMFEEPVRPKTPRKKDADLEVTKTA